jgi:DUF4097 and DUF4098 domain-containing protein YvlB
MRKSYTVMVMAFSAVLLSGAVAAAQDFHKTYAIGAGGTISIKNVSGDLKVVGYSGGSVVVDAYRTGRDRDVVKVEDLSAGNRIELKVIYPEHCNCDASVNFEVKVPAYEEYNFDGLSSVSGDIDISSVRGQMHASTVSGDLTVSELTGTLSASSVSGSVYAEIARIEGRGDMKFSSVSGNVNVKAPIMNADIEMSTISGALDTNFPIQVQSEQYGPGRSARGRVGSGGTNLRISTISGKVSLMKF